MYPRTTHSIGSRIGAADEHGAAGKSIGVGSKLAGEILRLDDVVRNDVGQFVEPEKRKLGEHAALIGNGRGKNDVECRKAVGGDDQQTIAEVVNVANLSAPKKFEPRKFCLRNNGAHLGRSHELCVLGCEWAVF